MRYAVQELARKHPVSGPAITGLVENLDDWRVRIVLEGSLADLDSFLARLVEIAPGHIQKLERFQSEATGEFQQFFIQR